MKQLGLLIAKKATRQHLIKNVRGVAFLTVCIKLSLAFVDKERTIKLQVETLTI